MKKNYWYILVILCLSLFNGGCTIGTDSIQDSNSQHTVEEETRESHEFPRVEVALVSPVDGDTIKINYKGNEESVRFLLIDTPETSHPQLGAQPYGKEAKVFTSEMVQHASRLEIEFDIGQQRDKYNRLLAYVYVDGVSVQEELLKNGLARVAYVYPPNIRYIDQYEKLQEEAKQRKIGIWEKDGYVQDKGFQTDDNPPKEMKSTNSPCLIKGNINTDGEKIFHLPGTSWYEKTKPEKWFCTKEEAIDDGFRAPK